MSDSGNIRVAVRCRVRRHYSVADHLSMRAQPLNKREIERGSTGMVRMDGNTTHLDPPKTATGTRSADRETKSFAFDHSYWSAGSKGAVDYASQQTVYDDLGVALLDNVFEGYNACLVAFGQTGSGKSYTMMGYGEDRGIIPLACYELFQRIDQLTSSTLSFRVEVSYLEIYQERVRDLLCPTNKGPLKVREHPLLGPYVEDLSKLVVTSFADIERLMDEGNTARTVASTQMNETSSRSHALFTVMLTQRSHDEQTGMDGEKVSRISLVDLAGSERANSTGATGTRLKEGALINKSLTTLGKVIAALAQASTGKGHKKTDHIPYRDSVLTWLLKDSLGGNSKTAMIATISPTDYEETLSTLRYAWQAKQIKNKPIINEDPTAVLIRELKEELATLRSRMAGASSEATYDASVPPEKQMVSYMTKAGELRQVSKADLQDQLDASEKLMSDVNQTWEEKLQKTQEANAEREAALEALGIIIEKNLLGVQTPKNIPHLVNLAEDPLASGALLYILKPGSTVVGNTDSTEAIDIRLGGENVLPRHCIFEIRSDGTVHLTSLPESTTIVNGQRIESNKARPLRSGYRIFIGSHAFRLSHPEEVRRTRQKSGEPGTPDPLRSFSRVSGANSPAQRSDSPAPPGLDSEEIDWSFARREAVMARLTGQDIDLDTLQDRDLDQLFEEVTRAHNNRHSRTASLVSGRDSRLDSSTSGDEDEVSSESLSTRQLSGSTWTDDTSIDATLRLDGRGSVPEALRQVQEELEGQLEAQRNEYEEKLRILQQSTAEASDVRTERAQMEERLEVVQSEMQHMLDEQRKHYETKVKQMAKRHSLSLRPEDLPPLTDAERDIARNAVQRWKRLTRVRMAEDALTNAVLVKEANVIAHEMGKKVSYQLAIVDGPPLHAPCASAVEGISGMADLDDSSDKGFDRHGKPCMAVKVYDREHGSIYFWSLEKLSARLAALRSLYSYIDRPQSAQHVSWDEPFFNTPAPRYTHLGTALVCLAALARPTGISVDTAVHSRLTGETVAICRVSIRPSAIVPSSGVVSEGDGALEDGSRLSFEVTTDRVCGLASSEMSSIHCQIRTASFVSDAAGPDEAVPSAPFDVDDDGSTSLRLQHRMAVSITPEVLQHFATQLAPIDFFICAKPAHLGRLEAWDLRREQAAKAKAKESSAGRRNEMEFVQEQRHDMMVSVEICELAGSGAYESVPLVTSGPLDPGVFFLRQGLQRRLVLRLSHTSGRSWSWSRVSNVLLGDVRLLDARGLINASPVHESTTLTASGKSSPSFELDGAASIDFSATWDSSTHASPFLNKPTAAGCRVLLRLTWEVDHGSCEPICFELDIGVSVHSRDSTGPSGFWNSLFSSPRLSHKAHALFAVRVAPAMAKRPEDLWRRDTSKVRVRGEEVLGKTWIPRGISLVEDHFDLVKRERRSAEVAASRAIVAAIPSHRLISPSGGEDEEEKLQAALALWQRHFGTKEDIKLVQEPTLKMTDRSREPSGERKLIASVQLVPRSTPVARRSYLHIMRDPSNDTWTRRYAVLRRPYLYLYENSDEISQVAVINTSAIRVESSTELTDMLGRPHVFSIYTSSTSLFVQAANEAERYLWMRALDVALV